MLEKGNTFVLFSFIGRWWFVKKQFLKIQYLWSEENVLQPRSQLQFKLSKAHKPINIFIHQIFPLNFIRNLSKSSIPKSPSENLLRRTATQIQGMQQTLLILMIYLISPRCLNQPLWISGVATVLCPTYANLNLKLLFLLAKT